MSPISRFPPQIESHRRVWHMSRVVLRRERDYWRRERIDVRHFAIRVVLIAEVPVDPSGQPDGESNLRHVKPDRIRGDDVLRACRYTITLPVVIIQPIARVKRDSLDGSCGDVKEKVAVTHVVLTD